MAVGRAASAEGRLESGEERGFPILYGKESGEGPCLSLDRAIANSGFVSPSVRP